ncbi:MAG: DUF5630 domain-containing protein [Gammaproteobacteria bacterium]|nr:DUF5630 domain-containing protein [Gammaproteobacteria bacterium]
MRKEVEALARSMCWTDKDYLEYLRQTSTQKIKVVAEEEDYQFSPSPYFSVSKQFLGMVDYIDAVKEKNSRSKIRKFYRAVKSGSVHAMYNLGLILIDNLGPKALFKLSLLSLEFIQHAVKFNLPGYIISAQIHLLLASTSNDTQSQQTENFQKAVFYLLVALRLSAKPSMDLYNLTGVANYQQVYKKFCLFHNMSGVSILDFIGELAEKYRAEVGDIFEGSGLAERADDYIKKALTENPNAFFINPVNQDQVLTETKLDFAPK